MRAVYPRSWSSHRGGGGGGGRVCEWGVPPPAQSAEPLMMCEVLSAQNGVIQQQIGSRLFFHRESKFCHEACS